MATYNFPEKTSYVYGTNKTTGQFTVNTGMTTHYPTLDHNAYYEIEIGDLEVWSISPYTLAAGPLNFWAGFSGGKSQYDARDLSWNYSSHVRSNIGFFDYYTRYKQPRTVGIQVEYYGVVSDVKIVYVTIPARESYQVSFDSNGASSGTAPGNITKYYGYDETAPGSDMTRNGCSFVGWSEERHDPSTDPSPSWNIIKPGDSISFNTAKTLYAVWKLEYVQPTLGPVNAVRREDETGNATDIVDITFTAYTGKNSGEQSYPTISSSGISVVHSDPIIPGLQEISVSFVSPNRYDVRITYKLASIDDSDSVSITVSDSNGMSVRTNAIISEPGVALHVLGTPGSMSGANAFGLGVNTFARNGYIEMKSANGILYNDGPAVIYESDGWGGSVDVTLDGVDLRKYIAIEVFCRDDSNNRFSRRFELKYRWGSFSGVQKWICGMFNIDVLFGNGLQGGDAYAKTLSFYFDLGTDSENPDTPIMKSYYGHTITTLSTGTIDKSNIGVYIEKIVGHTTLMGMTSITGGGGGGGEVSSVNGKTGNVMLYGTDIPIDMSSSMKLNEIATNMSVSDECLTIWRGQIPV